MTKVQSWSLAAFGVIALATGVLLATMGGTSAQTGTPTPAPTEDATDDGSDNGTDDGIDPTPPADPGTGTPGFGRGGPGCGGAVIENAAGILGMTEDELRTALQEEGATLGSVAESRGLGIDDFTAQLTAAATADLDAKLAAGDITQEQYDEILAGLPDRITAIVNGEAGFGHRGPPNGTGDGANFRPSPAFGGPGTDA